MVQPAGRDNCWHGVFRRIVGLGSEVRISKRVTGLCVMAQKVGLLCRCRANSDR